MIKKSRQNFDNPYGIEKIDTYSFDKPCIIGFFPWTTNDRMINGYLNKILYLLQVRKFPTIDSDYDIDDLPFDILVATDDSNMDEMILNAIPLNDVNEAKKRMRNINFISYCDGNYDAANLLKKLIRGLLKKGYTVEDAKDILKQIFDLQIVDNYRDNGNIKIPYASIVTIHDIYDIENTYYFKNDASKKYFKDNPFIHIIPKGKNDRRVLYKSFGEGTLSKEYGREHQFSDDYVNAPILNAIMSLYLIRLLHMSLNNELIGDNLTIRDEFEMLMFKVHEFLSIKNKNYDDFTRKELDEMNDYLMHEINIIFKNYIPIKMLSREEGEYLNQRDYAIRLLMKSSYEVLGYNTIESEMQNIYELINKIYNYYDNYNDDDIVEIERTNTSTHKLNKRETINKYMHNLYERINNFIANLNKIKISDNLSTELKIETYNYINEVLKNIREIINNEKIHMIINEYCDANELKFVK